VPRVGPFTSAPIELALCCGHIDRGNRDDSQPYAARPRFRLRCTLVAPDLCWHKGVGRSGADSEYVDPNRLPPLYAVANRVTVMAGPFLSQSPGRLFPSHTFP
jgi:hypothetical protein